MMNQESVPDIVVVGVGGEDGAVVVIAVVEWW